MNCCSQGNVTLWILIALLILGSKDGIFCSNIFNGCGLPVIIALLYCLYKNGTLAGILTFDIVKDGVSGEIYIDTPLFVPTVCHYTRGRSVADNDSGSRNYTIYPLADYTQEIAKDHSLVRAEKKDGTTLMGGGFSRDTLLQTVRANIPEEFLPDLNDQITEE